MVRSFLVPLLLAGALFAAVSAQDVEVQHKSNSCVVKGSYWPYLRSASRCRGPDMYWAYKTCWKYDTSVAANWRKICKRGCHFDAAVPGCVPGAARPSPPPVIPSPALPSPSPSPEPVGALDWKMCLNDLLSYEAADVSKQSTLVVSRNEPFFQFEDSKTTNLVVRKDAFNGTFCTQIWTLQGLYAFDVTPTPGQPASCAQRGFSFAPSATADDVTPTVGAKIWITAVEVLQSSGGSLMASQFEGFATSQVESTTVPQMKPADELPPKRIELNNGPYKLAFNKVFDAANFLRFAPSADQSDGYVAISCVYGKYSP